MNLPAIIEHAETLLKQGRSATAWEVLQSLPDESKTHPHVMEIRLECLVALHSWEEAEKVGSVFVQMMRDNPVLWLDLARAQMQLGKLDDARQSMRRVSELAPERRLAMLSDPLLDAAL